MLCGRAEKTEQVLGGPSTNLGPMTLLQSQPHSPKGDCSAPQAQGLGGQRSWGEPLRRRQAPPQSSPQHLLLPPPAASVTSFSTTHSRASLGALRCSSEFLEPEQTVGTPLRVVYTGHRMG